MENNFSGTGTANSDTIDEIRNDNSNEEGINTMERPKVRAVLKPCEAWKIPMEISVDSPLQKLKKIKKSFFVSKAAAIKNQENRELAIEMNHLRDKNIEIAFNYEKGSGIDGRVAIGGEDEEGKEGLGFGIMAIGFRDCTSLVIQSGVGVSMLHISPNTIRTPDEGGTEVKDQDIYGHMADGLRKLLQNKRGPEKTTGGVILTPEEIQQLQNMIDSGEIKITMLAGEENFVPSVAVELAERANAHALPFVNIPVHYVGNLGGGGGYRIYATTDEIYCIGSNNLVMKKGKNLPPEMFEYKKREDAASRT